MISRRLAALSAVVLASAWARDVAAAEPAPADRSNLRTRAEEVSFDARNKTLELSGDVRVDSPPFHMKSDRITLTRTRFGVEIDGKGSLAFCPCLGTPLRVTFDHAIVAPPGDLILRNPTLRFYGVPVLPLPYFWLRSAAKAGVLPPDLAWRGQDGFFAGGGVHVPWKSGASQRSLDLRAGAYVLRGYALGARLRGPEGFARARLDHLPGAPAPALPDTPDDTATGLTIEARGAAGGAAERAAWDADVVRGRRGVVATTDLDTAAKPWDRVAAEGAARLGPVVASSGVRATSRRGGGLTDLDAIGPFAALRSSGALSPGITYDASVEGGALRLSGSAATLGAGSVTPETLSFARAEIGALAATTLGPLRASLSARGAGDVTAQARDEGSDRAGTARAHVGAPLVKSYGSSRAAPNDPWLHLVEPFAEVAVLSAKGDGLLGTAPGRAIAPVSGTAPVAEVGITSTVGRWARREALTVAAAAGGAYGSRAVASRVRPLARARAAATLAWLGASADAAYVGGDELFGAGSGVAVVSRLRLGPRDGVRALGHVATREGIDPILARVLSRAPLEPPAGFLAAEGTTGGAGLVVPWSRVVTTSLGADGDLTRGELVAARAGVELRDRCGCLVVHANGAHRIGRDGVDVWLAIDFVAN